MDRRVIYIKTVVEKTGLSRQTIWRYIKAEKFPKPFKVENRNAWIESMIEMWIDDKVQNR